VVSEVQTLLLGVTVKKLPGTETRQHEGSP
jgi:hypothetical protein